MTALSPFFKYFGSKARSAKLYPEPRYETIEDSQCGGAGYPLNYPERNVILCDIDTRVTIIWKYLIHSSPEDIMRLPLMEPGQSIDTLDVCAEARLFISCCVNTSPFRKTLTEWKNGQNDGLWGAKWREKVASQVDAIKHWKVINGSYADLPNIECTHFVDPLYQNLAQHYWAGREHPTDYRHLAQWCKSRKGQVIVCEQTGADWLPFRHLATCAAVRNSGGKECEEAIWTNDGQAHEAEPVTMRKQLGLFETEAAE